MDQPLTQLEPECVALLSAGRYADTLDRLAHVNARDLSPRLRYLRAFTAMRLDRLVDALRWIQADPAVTPILRRLEIEVLCAFRRHREVVARIAQSFEHFPQGAADLAFFSLNELVFHRAFFEARFVIEHASDLFRKYQPGHLEDFQEKRKYVDDTEATLDKVLFDPRYDLIQVKRRLSGIDLPRVGWNQVTAGQLGTAAAQVTDCLAGVAVPSRPPGTSIFYVSPSQDPIAMSNLPDPKPTSGFVLRDVLLTDVNGTINLAVRDGIIFPQLTARGSTTNAGFCITDLGRNRIGYGKGFVLPPLGDVGYFNAVLNGLFGILIWICFFSDMPLVIPPGYNAILKRYAELLEINPNRLIWDYDCELYAFDVGLTFLNEGRHMDAVSLATFQQLVGQLLIPKLATVPVSDHIYISRRKARQRRLETEAELELALEKMGFRVVYFEDISPSEQIMVCAHARVVVAPHGAGLTNLVFSANLDLLIELIPESYHVRGFENLAQQLGAQYVGILGQSHAGSDMADLSWSVDVDAVAAIVGARIR